MNESNTSGVNGLPKHLELLLDTLVSHNEITSWNIYQNRYNNTCATIRFNDSCPTNSSIKYRKISDNQLNRNINRAKWFKMQQVDLEELLLGPRGAPGAAQEASGAHWG